MVNLLVEKKNCSLTNSKMCKVFSANIANLYVIMIFDKILTLNAYKKKFCAADSYNIISYILYKFYMYVYYMLYIYTYKYIMIKLIAYICCTL